MVRISESRKPAHRPGLLALATAVPPYQLKQSDVARFGADLFSGSFRDFERLAPVYGNAAIDNRYSCVPLDWYAETHGFKERNELYVENAVDLLEEATKRALAQAGLVPTDIDAVVAVSSSGIATPSLDALIVERMNLRRDVERLPVFGLGCAGGVIGLARAGQIAVSRPGANVLLLVVELCGLTFRSADRSKSNIIATALFGDGAAAAIIKAGKPNGVGGTMLGAWGEHTWPDTLGVMGWRVEDDGFGVLFSRDIPGIVERDYRAALDAYLDTNGLSLDDIDSYAVHPGGAKVVEALEKVFGLENGGLVFSRSVLRDFGNMSAATVMFVLERMLAEGEASGRILMSSLGPGFTAAFLSLEQS